MCLLQARPRFGHGRRSPQIRLLALAEVITLPEIQLRALPGAVTPATVRVHEGVRVLFGWRWYLDSGLPIPYTASFIFGWCGVTRWQAVSARALLRRHVLCEVGRIPTPNFPRETQLVLP
jgi:hypothetical protein